MPGFFITNRSDSRLNNVYPEKCIYRTLRYKEYKVSQHTLNKFIDDKVFIQDESCVVVTEGVILNKIELFEKYGVNDVAKLIYTMYQKNGEKFWSELRGNMSGALFDKVRKVWLIYTDHIGDTPIYYYNSNDIMLVGSQLNYIVDCARCSDIKLSVDEHAIYNMLTWAWMESNETYAHEIKRLRGGTYLKIEDGSLDVKEYHVFTKNTERFEHASDEQIIEEIDKCFRRAVEREYSKDEEYGYEHLAELSGGLDSRMNMWVAHDIKPVHLNLITFGQGDCLDEKIAKDIARYSKDELIIKTADDFSEIYDIDENVSMNSGGSLYIGQANENRLLKLINVDRFGILHTGQVGDAILGSMVADMSMDVTAKMYSTKLAGKLGKLNIDKYGDKELYLLYVRGFQGACNPHQMYRNYCEVCSPFLDVDFFQLCMDIPWERRKNHLLYKKWIISKYPEAAEFPWERLQGAKITYSEMERKVWMLKKYGIKYILKKFGIASIRNISDELLPIDKWLDENDDAKTFLDMYFREHLVVLEQLKISKDLKVDMENMFNAGSATEKIMVLTVMSALSLFLL